MKKLTISLVACLLAMSFAGNAQTRLIEKVEKKSDEAVIAYEKYELSNGLTVVVHEDHSDPMVHVDVTYHVGSAREEIGKSGFAHFFEHMMFQGSDNVGDEQHFKIVTESGGTLNGSTNRDRTNYYETVPSNQLEKMIWLEADRMGFLLDAVTQRKFEIQRETVKNERGQNYDNRPYGLVSEMIARNLYPYGHPYSWLTIGYIEDLNSVGVDDLKNFFLRWYGPNNATLTVGGDVKAADVVKLVEKYFGSIPRGPEVKDRRLDAAVLASDRYVTLTDNYARVPQLVISYPTVPAYHEDEAALDCLAEIIGQGKNSMFYQEIVKTQKAVNASAYNSTSELAGEFRMILMPTPGVSLADSRKLIDSAIEAFEKRGVTDEDIAKFTGAIESDLIRSLQSVSGKVRQLAAYETYTGSPNRIGKELERYTQVTREDVMRVYDQYIRNKPAVILSVVPKNDPGNIVAPENYTIDKSNYKAPDYGYAGLTYKKPKDSFDRSRIPVDGENPVVQVPAFWKKDLDSGIKAIGTESNELPMVTLSLTIPGGHILQARDTSKAGLARMFALMMNEDTKNYTAEEMQAELQKLGSSVNVNSEFDGISFNVQSLTKNLDKTLDLLEERMFAPRFTEEAFSRIQKQTLESFKLRKSRPSAIAGDIIGRLSYGQGHILGISSDGTEFSVRNITLKDIEGYYQNYFTSRDAQLVVVGDVGQDEILGKLDFLDKLPAKKIELPSLASAPEAPPAKIYVVDVPKAAQTEFRVGYVTGLKYDATGEFFKLGLANYVLGGAFNSRINLNLREDKGWTYGARFRLDADKYSGDYFFSSGIRANATDSALVEVMNELSAYAEKGITDEELKFMRSAIGQRDALRYETPFQKAGFIRRMLEHDLPADYVAQQSRIINEISREEINRLASKWMNTDNMYILLVGDKASIQPGLQRLGYEMVELDLNGNPKMQASLTTPK